MMALLALDGCLDGCCCCFYDYGLETRTSDPYVEYSRIRSSYGCIRIQLY
eukprot:SAG25_NODE_16_length_24288_cov_31.926950_22_plen_50_part_00